MPGNIDVDFRILGTLERLDPHARRPMPPLVEIRVMKRWCFRFTRQPLFIEKFETCLMFNVLPFNARACPGS